MNRILSAISFADHAGFDYFPVGVFENNKFKPLNAIAIVGFNDMSELLDAARELDGAVCLLKSETGDLLEHVGDIEYVVQFLIRVSANKLEHVQQGILRLVGVVVNGLLFPHPQKEKMHH